MNDRNRKATLSDAEQDFQEFLALARNGLSASADNVEHAAWRLAQAVIDDANCLSMQAIQGFSVFTAIAYRDAVVAASIIETDTTISDE